MIFVPAAAVRNTNIVTVKTCNNSGSDFFIVLLPYEQDIFLYQ